MSTLTYVFCLVRAARRPALPKIDRAHSLPGGRDMRALPAGDALWLIAATVPADDYNEAALMKGLQDLDWVGRRAMAHETTVERFLSAKAVLPMQLFTLFTSDERALEHVVRQRPEILRILRRIEQKVEWGLRLTFDETAVRNAIDSAQRATAGGTSKSARAFTVRATSGAAYLARKRDLLEVTRGQLLAARGEAERLFRALKKEAAASRRRSETEQASTGARLLLDAAFLVSTSRARAFRAAVAREAKAIGGSGINVSLTGPWPPYNFISSSPSAKQARGNV